jgi:hypothetical protein
MLSPRDRAPGGLPQDPTDVDRGADGPAALSRPHRAVVVLADARSRFRDAGVEVLRYESTQLDSLRRARAITYAQYTAARHATALFRGAGLGACVTSRYEEWVSGARGRWVATDDGEDEAAPWRLLLAHLPSVAAQALESFVMNTLVASRMPHLLEALDRVAAEIGA